MTTAALNVSLASRVFCITGGASGMGAATALQLARQGAAAIWIADRNKEHFAKVKAEIQSINNETQVYTNEVDVSNSAEVDKWVDQIIKESGALHGAVNAAGIAQSFFKNQAGPAILAETDEEIQRIMAVNFNGVVFCTRAQVRAMSQMAKGANPSIVNIASYAAMASLSTGYTYSASKAACAHFTACVAKDVYPFGIRINAVLPGSVLTPMTPQLVEGADPQVLAAATKGLEVLDPADVGRTITWLLSEASLHVYGTKMNVGVPFP